MGRRTISKGEIVYSCRRQNRDNICAVFSGVYALGSVMENHITSKGEKSNIARKWIRGSFCTVFDKHIWDYGRYHRKRDIRERIYGSVV